MNISPFAIYLWQLVDELRYSFDFAALAMVIVGGIALLIAIMEEQEKDHFVMIWAKRIFQIGIGFCIFGTFIPSSKTIAMMVVIPEITHSKAVEKDLPELYDLAMKALKEQLAPKK